MSERKKSNRGVRGTKPAVTAALCAGVVCAVILLVGSAASCAVTFGWMPMEQIRYAVVLGLWLGALLGGLFLCAKTKWPPILCGIAVGGAEVLLCLILGALFYGIPDGTVIVIRLLAGTAGGVLSGVLCAVARSARHH